MADRVARACARLMSSAREEFDGVEGGLCRFHDFVVVSVAEQAGAPQLADSVSDRFNLPTVVRVGGDLQGKLMDCQAGRVQIGGDTEKRVFDQLGVVVG